MLDRQRDFARSWCRPGISTHDRRSHPLLIQAGHLPSTAQHGWDQGTSCRQALATVLLERDGLTGGRTTAMSQFCSRLGCSDARSSCCTAEGVGAHRLSGSNPIWCNPIGRVTKYCLRYQYARKAEILTAAPSVLRAGVARPGTWPHRRPLRKSPVPSPRRWPFFPKRRAPNRLSTSWEQTPVA